SRLRAAVCLRRTLFCLARLGYRRELHSFPTRRSSDLHTTAHGQGNHHAYPCDNRGYFGRSPGWDGSRADLRSVQHHPESDESVRSEEHTSELQSRENLVCRLLLEKKKTLSTQHRTIPT